MNKFRNLPAVITLLAGFITSVIMILHRYSLVNFMWILVCTMLVFRDADAHYAAVLHGGRRFLAAALAISTASAVALAPSYIEALEMAIPVSSLIID